MADLEPNPEQVLPVDDSGEDTQLRFHYQAQLVAVHALSLISPEPSYARIYCELHEDALLKHFDRTYTACQVTSRERSQPKFKATEEKILKTIRNFARLQRRFGSRMRQFLIATNHPFAADADKNDINFLIDLAKSSDAGNEVLTAFMTSFESKYKGFQLSEILAVLEKLLIRETEPDFNSAFGAVVEKLRKLPDFSGADEETLNACARALIAKVESCSRKQVERTNEEENEDEFARSVIQKKLLTPTIVLNTLQSSAGSPLGTTYRRIAIKSVPLDVIPQVKSSIEASGHSLLSTKRKLADGTKFQRPELETLLKGVSAKPTLIVGEPGSGKSVVLADFCDALRAEGKQVLVIKCEDVHKGVKDQLTLAEHLSLPYGAAECIKTIAEKEPVVLLVDQLDAIGALWDTQTARMQAVLSLVHMVKSLPNVQIVMSCREFDAKYDVRVSGFGAAELRLELPQRKLLAQVLSAHGLDCSKWPDDVVAVLQNPQHLDIFIDLLKDSAGQVETIRTYMDLLALLWSKRVIPEDSRILSKVCERIQEHKQLFIPLAEFDGQRKSLDRLSGAGILRYTNNGNSIGFAHQTLVEFCLARTFVQGDKSFSEYVIEQQNSLHCRPLIWNCLHYLRNCDLVNYEKHLSNLLSRDDLRNHIKSLLVQFLTHAGNLTATEKGLVLPRIRSGYVSDLDLMQMCKNSEWLDILLPSYLPMLMTVPAKNELSVRILSDACKLREKDVINLLNKHWLNAPAQDRYTLAVLKEVKTWNTDLCESVCTIISRNDFNPTIIEYLISDISSCAPDLAPSVVASWIRKQYIDACKHPKGNFVPPAGLPQERRYIWIYKAMEENPRLKDLVAILDKGERYALPEIAQRSPITFVEAVWPVFREMIEELCREKDDTRNIYLSDSAHWTGQKLAKLRAEKYSLVAIFAQIMPDYASTDPQRFERFVAENVDSKSLFIHRLLCSGMAAIALEKPEFILGYLCENERRLMIGSVYDAHSESIVLIQKISPKLAQVLLEKLEQTILVWQLYLSKEILEAREGRSKSHREQRLRLLCAIHASVRSTSLSGIIEEESRLLPGYDREEMPEPEVFWAQSPMSAERMSVESIEEIQAMFEELDDDQDEHPSNFKLGGVVEASRELEKLAETDLPKALQVANSFRPDRDETAVSYLISGAARCGALNLRQMEDIVRTFVQRGFTSDKFLSAVACALDGKLEKSGPCFSEDMVLLLENAVKGLSDSPVDWIERNRDDREESILWGGSHTQAVSMEGMRPIVASLTHHYFCANPPELQKWLDLIFFAVSCRKDPRTWQSLALTDLWRLNQVDYESARNFIKTLHDQQPEALTCPYGVLLLSFLIHVLEPSHLSDMVNKIRQSDWNLAEQAAGELAALDFFLLKSSWSKQIVEEALRPGSNERLAAGVAYTTGRAWLATSHRKESVRVVDSLLNQDSERVCRALASKMRLAETKVPDDETFWLLDSLCARPKLFRQGFAYIIKAVPDLILWTPDRIYNLLKAITNEADRDFINHNTQLPYFAKPVVDATLTLQKIPGFETRALELFEQQMALGMNEAHEIVKEIDRIPKLASQQN